MTAKPDSTIKRGDRTDTGDNQARPDELGAGPAQPTVDKTAFGAASSIAHPSSDRFDPEEELADQDGFETMQPDDGRLGLTNTPNKPAEDWAADTGASRSNEEKQSADHSFEFSGISCLWVGTVGPLCPLIDLSL